MSQAEEELKNISQAEQKAAEEETKAMEKEARLCEKEVHQRAQAQQQQQQQQMDSHMTVAVGGYGHERPPSIGGAGTLKHKSLESKSALSSSYEIQIIYIHYSASHYTENMSV